MPAGAPTASLVGARRGRRPGRRWSGPDGAAGRDRQQVRRGRARRRLATRLRTRRPTSASRTRAPVAGPCTEAPGSPAAIASVEYCDRVTPPKVSAKVTGKGFERTLRYKRERPGQHRRSPSRSGPGTLLHVIGRAKGKAGTIRFHPRARLRRSPPARRADHQRRRPAVQGADADVVHGAQAAEARPRQGAAHQRDRAEVHLQLHAADERGAHAGEDRRHRRPPPPAAWSRPRTRRGSVPVIGYRDGITVTVIGLARRRPQRARRSGEGAAKDLRNSSKTAM